MMNETELLTTLLAANEHKNPQGYNITLEGTSGIRVITTFALGAEDYYLVGSQVDEGLVISINKIETAEDVRFAIFDVDGNQFCSSRNGFGWGRPWWKWDTPKVYTPKVWKTISGASRNLRHANKRAYVVKLFFPSGSFRAGHFLAPITGELVKDCTHEG